MDPTTSFASLLELARRGEYVRIAALPGAGVPAEVVALAAHGEEAAAFMRGLDVENQKAFVRAVAAYEDTVGGIGSVTLLRWLLPVKNDPDRNTLDWILRHTRSYCYYAQDARSLEQYDEQRRSAAAYQRARAVAREANAIENKAQGIKRATERLPNAVRRGDVLAVKALIAQGADPAGLTIAGTALIDYARNAGRDDIVVALAGFEPDTPAG